MKTIKHKILYSHMHRPGICQVSIREYDKCFFAVISDFSERKKIIFKKCDTLLEAGLEFKSFLSRLKKKDWKELPIKGTHFEFSADTFDFSQST